VFTRVGGRNPVEQIYVLMRNVLSVQDALTPLLGPLDALATQPFQVIHEDLREYFRDVHDHLAAVVQRVGTMHDLVTTILAANLTSVSVRQNEDMRKISAWVAIAAVPTVTGAIYGMNFDHMPELKWHLGYPVVVGVMVAIDVYLFYRFRKSGWL
jgi:magnesium transporter